MAFFRLDVDGINDNVERHVNYSNSLKEQCELVYNSLIGVDSCWRDPNAISFISRIKRDKYNLNDYIIYINKIYKEVKNFSDSIKNACKKYGYGNTRTIKFDDSRISDCIRYLNQAIDILNNNLRRLNSLKYDVQYASLSSVYKEISNIKDTIEMIEDLKKDISGFCNLIDDCISDSKSRKSRIEKESLGITLMQYGWKTTESNNHIENVNNNNSLGFNDSKISLNQRKNNIPPVVNANVIDKNEIAIDDRHDVNLNYNSVNYSTPNKSEIDYQYIDDGFSLNSNYYNNRNNVNDVELKKMDNSLDKPVTYTNVQLNNTFNSSINPDVNIQLENNISMNNNNNINLNSYDNKIDADNVQISKPSAIGMNFSNNFADVDLNYEVKTYNTPNNSVNMKNIGVNGKINILDDK